MYTLTIRSVKNALALAVLWLAMTTLAAAETTSIKLGVSKGMNAELLLPDGPGPYPAILLLHTSGGLQAADLDYAKRLVEAGYVVAVPAFLDAYGIKAKTRQAAFTAYGQQIYDDLVAGLEQLRGNPKVNPKKLGALGFSNGGYFALWLAATGQVQVGISYYGALTGAGSDRTLERFQQAFSAGSSPVLILHGTDDSTVPVRKAVELEAILSAAKAPHDFHQYADAEHRFDRDRRAGNDAAAADAWSKSQEYLTRYLKGN